MDSRILRLALLLFGSGATLLLVVGSAIDLATRNGVAAGLDVAVTSGVCIAWVACSYAALATVAQRRISLVMEVCALALGLGLALVWVYVWLENARHLAA